MPGKFSQLYMLCLTKVPHSILSSRGLEGCLAWLLLLETVVACRLPPLILDLGATVRLISQRYSEGKEGEGRGSGVGGGGGGMPLALIVVFKGIAGPDGLKVLSLRPPGMFEKIGEAIPMVMEKIKEMRESKKD